MERALSDAHNAASSDDPAYRILFAAHNVENETRTEAWRIFWELTDLDEFIGHLDTLNLPLTTKADLWEAKVPCSRGEWISVPSWLYKDNPALKGWTPRRELMTAWGENGKPPSRVPVPVMEWDAKGNPLPGGLRPVSCDQFQPPPAGYSLDIPDSLRWPEARATWLQALTHTVPPALFMGFLVGFLGGLGMWLLYKLVQFAIRG